MNWFKMLPNASLRAPLQPGRWFTKGIRREPETQINDFNDIIMDGEFLAYAVSEFYRYAMSMYRATQDYHVENPQT